MTTAYQKYLEELHQASNNADNLQNLSNEEYEEDRAYYEAKAKVGEDMIEGIMGFHLGKGLYDSYQKFKKARNQRRQNNNENENQEEAQNQEEDGNPDNPAPANEDDDNDDFFDMDDNFEYIQDADFEDMLGEQARQMLGTGSFDDFDIAEGTEMQPMSFFRGSGIQDNLLEQPDDYNVSGLSDGQQDILDNFLDDADIDVADDFSSNVGGVVVPEDAYGQLQGTRDDFARLMRGSGDRSGPVEDIFDEDYDPISDYEEDLPDEGEELEHSGGFELEHDPDQLPTEPEGPTTFQQPEHEAGPDADQQPEADEGEGAEQAGEDVAEDVGEDVGEDLAEDYTLGSLAGPAGEVLATAVAVYQIVEAFLGMSHVHHHYNPTQAGISMTPEGNTPTTMDL